jgi:hypothetical protein
MIVKGSELIFISRILRDGSGVEPIGDDNMEHENNTEFTLASLSITYGTYIASEFNSYVVKKKNIIATAAEVNARIKE